MSDQDLDREVYGEWMDPERLCISCGVVILNGFTCPSCDLPEVQGPQDDPWYRYRQNLASYALVARLEAATELGRAYIQTFGPAEHDLAALEEYSAWADGLPCGCVPPQECRKCAQAQKEER